MDNRKLTEEDIINIINDAIIKYRPESKVILIGGKALNKIVEIQRISQDIDLSIVSKLSVDGQHSQNEFRKIVKKAIKAIEEQLKVEIRHLENFSEDSNYLRRERISHYSSNKIVTKIYIYIESKHFYVEISQDETIVKLNTTEVNDLSIEVLSLESILGIKTIIATKRIDEGTIFMNDNYRHIYDIYRILSENKEHDYNIVMETMNELNIYEMKRKSIDKYKYEMDLEKVIFTLDNFLDTKLTREQIDEIGVSKGLNKRQLEDLDIIDFVIYKITDTYGYTNNAINKSLFVDILKNHIIALRTNNTFIKK